MEVVGNSVHPNKNKPFARFDIICGTHSKVTGVCVVVKCRCAGNGTLPGIEPARSPGATNVKFNAFEAQRIFHTGDVAALGVRRGRCIVALVSPRRFLLIDMRWIAALHSSQLIALRLGKRGRFSCGPCGRYRGRTWRWLARW